MSETTGASTEGIQIVIVSPESTVLDKPAKFVAMPLFDGEIGIGRGHSPMIGRLGFGEMRIRFSDEENARYYVDGGFVQVADNVVSILTNRAVLSSELNAEELEKQLEESLGQSAAGDEAIDLRERQVLQAREQLRMVKKQG